MTDDMILLVAASSARANKELEKSKEPDYAREHHFIREIEVTEPVDNRVTIEDEEDLKMNMMSMARCLGMDPKDVERQWNPEKAAKAVKWIKEHR